MEDVLTKNNNIRGFIDPNGILIRVTNIDFGENNPVEIVAESIVRNVLKCNVSEQEIKEFSLEKGKYYQNYLLEKYRYIFIHLQISQEKVEIKELNGPSNLDLVSELQKKRILSLCKESNKEEIPINKKNVLSM